MPCDAQELLDAIPCDLCRIPVGLVDYVELVLLCAIRDGDSSMACDAQSLLDEANCLMCRISPGQVRYAKLGILCDINAGGGGGAQEVYIGRDPAPPDDPTKPALSFPSGGGTLTQWDVASQTWV